MTVGFHHSLLFYYVSSDLAILCSRPLWRFGGAAVNHGILLNFFADRPIKGFRFRSSMTKPPLILVSPNIESKGQEFADLSISLSARYQQALMNAGGIPLTLPATVSREVIAESVSRCDGVLMTGGEDVEPSLYADWRSGEGETDGDFDAGWRGARLSRKSCWWTRFSASVSRLLAICRGHQVLNVALGRDVDRGYSVAESRTQSIIGVWTNAAKWCMKCG